MKKIIAVFMVIVILFVMNGCATAGSTANGSETSTETVTGNQSEFETFKMELVGKCIIDQSPSDDHEIYYYRDTVTDVLYIAYQEYRKGGLTIMLDPENGLPLTYTRYMELYNNLTKEPVTP